MALSASFDPSAGFGPPPEKVPTNRPPRPLKRLPQCKPARVICLRRNSSRCQLSRRRGWLPDAPGPNRVRFFQCSRSSQFSLTTRFVNESLLTELKQARKGERRLLSRGERFFGDAC